jgi:SMC interacting uncharacterized protein involved in chromosome segregation
VPAGVERDAEFLLEEAMNTGMGMNEVIKRAVTELGRNCPYRVAAHQKMSLQTEVFRRIVNSTEINERMK